jgi:hypothetical protein
MTNIIFNFDQHNRTYDSLVGVNYLYVRVLDGSKNYLKGTWPVYLQRSNGYCADNHQAQALKIDDIFAGNAVTYEITQQTLLGSHS